MTHHIFYLATCSTCQRILKEWKPSKKFILQDIKTEKITASQLEKMIELAGSAEALFSRRSMKYQALGLKEKKLTEKEYRKLILDEYTFLKRPVLVSDNKIFIGNTASVVQAAKELISLINKTKK
ncbi:MAG: hypothetical protein IPH66_16435 [Crocinitomicaceae bacterium]|nr:hypothetical protein [Crocinitomicaceae bacterium]